MQHFDSNPDSSYNLPKPPSNIKLFGESSVQLSKKELEQIKEVFELFDTDGGNTMDSDELDAAMFAMGFRPENLSKKIGKQSSFKFKHEIQHSDLLQMDHIDADGSKYITLEEFTALMKGEVKNQGPLEGIWAAFAVLCQGGNAQGAQSGPGSHSLGTLEQILSYCILYLSALLIFSLCLYLHCCIQQASQRLSIRVFLQQRRIRMLGV